MHSLRFEPRSCILQMTFGRNGPFVCWFVHSLEKIRKTVNTLAVTCAVVVAGRVRQQKFINTIKGGIEKESFCVKNLKIQVQKVLVVGLVWYTIALRTFRNKCSQKQTAQSAKNFRFF